MAWLQQINKLLLTYLLTGIRFLDPDFLTGNDISAI